MDSPLAITVCLSLENRNVLCTVNSGIIGSFQEEIQGNMNINKGYVEEAFSFT